MHAAGIAWILAPAACIPKNSVFIGVQMNADKDTR